MTRAPQETELLQSLGIPYLQFVDGSAILASFYGAFSSLVVIPDFDNRSVYRPLLRVDRYLCIRFSLLQMR